MFAVQLERSEKELDQGSSYQIGHTENGKGNEEGKNGLVGYSSCHFCFFY